MNIQERIKELECNSGSREIAFILEKYYFQRIGEEYPSSEEFAEDEEELAEAKADYEWGNDGKLTGIKDDAEFRLIQRAIFNKVIYRV